MCSVWIHVDPSRYVGWSAHHSRFWHLHVTQTKKWPMRREFDVSKSWNKFSTENSKYPPTPFHQFSQQCYVHILQLYSFILQIPLLLKHQSIYTCFNYCQAIPRMLLISDLLSANLGFKAISFVAYLGGRDWRVRWGSRSLFSVPKLVLVSPAVKRLQSWRSMSLAGYIAYV
jgi:hypothetical protein